MEVSDSTNINLSPSKGSPSKRSAELDADETPSSKSPRCESTTPEVESVTKLPGNETGSSEKTEDKAADEAPNVVEEEDDHDKITVCIKSMKETREIKVKKDCSITELREIVAKKFSIKVDSVGLIYDAKKLEDASSIDQCGITSGSTVHLVIKTALLLGTGSGSSSQAHYGPNTFAKVGVQPINYIQLQMQMQRQMMNNPEMIRQMINNPLVQQLMENPEVMKDMLNSVPQTRDMMEKNPDIKEMLHDPEVMKETLATVRNPKMLNELIESQSKFADTSPKKGANVDMPDIDYSKMNMQTMMQQMNQNSGMIQQLLQAPYMSTMLQGLSSNPEWAQELVRCNPMLAGNPQLQQQITQLLPLYMKQMQNPDVMAMMSNPLAVQAMLKVQKGLNVLHTESPSFGRSSDHPSMATPPSANELADHLKSTTDEEDKSKVPPTAAIDPVTSIMSQLVNQMSNKQLDTPYEERYAEQLEMLDSMGFRDRQENLKVLVGTFGYVDAAAEKILRSQGQLV